MANTICGRCGKENTREDGVNCPECGPDKGVKSKKRLWYSSVAAVIVVFAGAAYLFGHTNGWEFSWDSLLRRPAAVINGEPIARSEARERFRVARLMMEKQTLYFL